MSGLESPQCVSCLPFLQCTHGETEAQKGKRTSLQFCMAREPVVGPGPGLVLSPSLLCNPGIPRGHSRDDVPPQPWPHLTWSWFASSFVALSGIILAKRGQPPGRRQLMSFRCVGQTASRQAEACADCRRLAGGAGVQRPPPLPFMATSP